MLRTKYYLTRADGDGPTALYAACFLEGKRKKIYLPITVLPSEWDAKKQKFRRSRDNWSEDN